LSENVFCEQGQYNIHLVGKKRRKEKKKDISSVSSTTSEGTKSNESMNNKEEESESSNEEYQSEEEEEDIEDYRRGGYHPVKIDDVFKTRYKIIKKMGWGHFSTVWVALDIQTNKQVAMKIQKSASHYTEAALDEIKLLQKVTEFDIDNVKCVVHLLDSFEHKGPNGTHICMVFELLGPNLLTLIRRYNYEGIPIPIIKDITRQILIGLDFLHTQCQIIHTDLKPENVLFYGCELTEKPPDLTEKPHTLHTASSTGNNTVISNNRKTTTALTKNQKKKTTQKKLKKLILLHQNMKINYYKVAMKKIEWKLHHLQYQIIM